MRFSPERTQQRRRRRGRTPRKRRQFWRRPRAGCWGCSRAELSPSMPPALLLQNPSSTARREPQPLLINQHSRLHDLGLQTGWRLWAATLLPSHCRLPQSKILPLPLLLFDRQPPPKLPPSHRLSPSKILPLPLPLPLLMVDGQFSPRWAPKLPLSHRLSPSRILPLPLPLLMVDGQFWPRWASAVAQWVRRKRARLMLLLMP